MAQPTWNRTLAEVLQQNTVTKTKKSQRTGNEYQAEIVPKLEVVSTGSIEENDGEFNYAIVDTVHQLEYTVKAPTKVDVVFGTALLFSDVTGGVIGNSNRGWYKAESVEIVK